MFKYIDFGNVWVCTLITICCLVVGGAVLVGMDMSGYKVTVLIILGLVIGTMVDEIHWEFKAAKEYYERLRRDNGRY